MRETIIVEPGKSASLGGQQYYNQSGANISISRDVEESEEYSGAAIFFMTIGVLFTILSVFVFTVQTIRSLLP